QHRFEYPRVGPGGRVVVHVDRCLHHDRVGLLCWLRSADRQIVAGSTAFVLPEQQTISVIRGRAVSGTGFCAFGSKSSASETPRSPSINRRWTSVMAPFTVQTSVSVQVPPSA